MGLAPADGSGDAYPDFPEDIDGDLNDVSNFEFFPSRFAGRFVVCLYFFILMSPAPT